MALKRIGIRQPEHAVNANEHAFHDDGMHYELFVDAEDSDRLYVAADHEDVGQVTWFDATPEDWSDLLDSAEEIVS